MAKERIDRDDEDLVRLYLTDIGQYLLLTKDDEVRLAKAIEEGKAAEATLNKTEKQIDPTKRRELNKIVKAGAKAERQFVQSNLRLVVSIAKKYQASGLPLLDLIQEGNLGLMHAVEKFDWRKGFKFSTYATWWIRQAITRGIANTGRTIRLPVHAGDTLARLQKARSRLELKFGRHATLAELAEEVEMPADKVTEALRFAAEPLHFLSHCVKMAMPNSAMLSKTAPQSHHLRLRPLPCCQKKLLDYSHHLTSVNAKFWLCVLVLITASHEHSKKSAKHST